jgi:YrbI family 3-deoxy-D-manno-octulosonate 8-phosphate phosphatase
MEYKSFHVRDGHGIKLARRAGFEVALITGRSSDIVDKRADELGVKLVFQGIKEKKPIFDKLCEDLNLKMEQVAMLGDDVVDAPILREVGFAAVPPEAPVEVRSLADHVTLAPGGHGACREFIELILKAQGHWKSLMVRYFG